MKTVLVQGLLAIAVISSGHADAPTKATPKTLGAGADGCKELTTGSGKCAAGAKLKTKALGTATIYRADGEQVRIAMVIDTGKELVMSPPFEVSVSDCGAGKCQNIDKATPKLSEVKIGGADAIVLDITSAMSRTYNEGPMKSVRWQARTFVICGKGAKGWSCLTTSVGDRDAPCSAVSLTKDGELKKTCTETEALSF